MGNDHGHHHFLIEGFVPQSACGFDGTLQFQFGYCLGGLKKLKGVGKARHMSMATCALGFGCWRVLLPDVYDSGA